MSKPLDSFAGKTALVTGAVSGLGFGIAQALAARGGPARARLSQRDGPGGGRALVPRQRP